MKISLMAYFSHGYLRRSVTNSPDGRREIAFAISFRRGRLRSGMESMMNFHNKKNQKIISSVIIIILVLAMVIPTLVSFL